MDVFLREHLQYGDLAKYFGGLTVTDEAHRVRSRCVPLHYMTFRPAVWPTCFDNVSFRVAGCYQLNVKL
jgi:hypothetical protein